MAGTGALIEPSEFDLVVLGTGLVESLVAAAASKAGKSVLQLDPAGFYGGAWASLQLDEFLQALSVVQGAHSNNDKNSSGGSIGSSKSRDADAGPVEGPEEGGGDAAATSAGGATVPEAPRLGTLTQSFGNAAVLRALGVELGRSSQYSLDLAPKVLYGAGPTIDLLLGSGAHNYTEFKLVQGSYLWEQGQLRPVPASRSQVFKDRSLGLAQKRALMKFLKGASEALQGEGPLQASFDQRPFTELMASQGLEASLQALLLHAVLMLDFAQQAQHAEQGQQAQHAGTAAAASSGEVGGQQQSEGGGEAAAQQGGAQQAQQEGGIKAADALRLLGLYFRSVGRYGQDAGPFLTPMYGCGELPQAFCRVAAVGGAVQVLRCAVEGLMFDEHTFSCTGVELASGQAIRCQALAAGQEHLQDWLSTFHPASRPSATHRCVAILDGPLLPGELQTLLVLPPGAVAGAGAGASAVHALPAGQARAGAAVRGLVLSASTRVCPDCRYLLHLWTPAAAASQVTALEALRPALDALVDTSALQQQAADPGQAAEQSLGAEPPLSEQQQQEQQPEQHQLGDADAVPDLAMPASTTEEHPPGGGGSSSSRGSGGHEMSPQAAAGPAASGQPRALLAAFYTQGRQSVEEYAPSWPANTVLCPGPDHSVSFLSAVEEAKACFSRLYPEEEGFPLEPQERDGEADSDEEALEALQAALGSVAASGAAEEVLSAADAAGESEGTVATGGPASAEAVEGEWVQATAEAAGEAAGAVAATDAAGRAEGAVLAAEAEGEAGGLAAAEAAGAVATSDADETEGTDGSSSRGGRMGGREVKG